MRTLLLADDSVTTQRVVALTFSDESFRVVTVSDGQQAIDSMAVMRPDIVLAGTTLPRTNGYELAEYMRSIGTLKDVPVLLLSGAFESVDQAQLKASGARGVIEKPLEPTAVISRVKELLGLKDARPTPSAGRLVTSAETPADRKAPLRAPAAPKHGVPVSSWDALRQDTGLEPDARSVEGNTPGSGREDYLDTLDAAFDSLDQHLAGRHTEANPTHRNPSPPLGQAAGASDPRSPGRRPAPTSEAASPNSVFEVDTDWFTDDDRKTRDLGARHDMIADAHEAVPARSAATPANPIFEVDDEWFAEDEKTRETRRDQHQDLDLAAEMGIHEIKLPDAPPGIGASAPAPLAPSPPLVPPASSMADDFAALLAFETGNPAPQQEPAVVEPAAPAVAPVATPDMSEAMLDQIAQRVADRLNAGTFGSSLRETMTATIRDTVRSVVSDTSERLVRDEIARVKARAERDTQ